MSDVLLNVGNDLPGIGFVPVAVQLLGHPPELDDEVAREFIDENGGGTGVHPRKRQPKRGVDARFRVGVRRLKLCRS